MKSRPATEFAAGAPAPSSKQTLTILGRRDPQQSPLGQQLVGHSLHIPFLTWVHLITAPQMCAENQRRNVSVYGLTTASSEKPARLLSTVGSIIIIFSNPILSAVIIGQMQRRL